MISLADYKRALLVPMCVAAALLLAVFVGAEYLRQRDAADEARLKTLAAARQAFALAVDRDSDKLAALLVVITRNQRLQAAFQAGQRENLFAVADPLFQILRRDHDITHFYFIDTDRRMFLRVQSPARFGDRVERATLLGAEQTGKLSAGLELGPLGVYTLRVVSPWRDVAGKLLGYIELGIEIDRTLGKLQQLTGVTLFMLVDKNLLDRRRWEEGMQMVGRVPNWDRYPQHVLVGMSPGADAALLATHPAIVAGASAEGGVRRVRLDQRVVDVDVAPMTDVGGRTVGLMVVAQDFSEAERRQQRFMAAVIGAALLVGFVLLLTANRFIDHTYARLARTRKERDDLHEKAQRDALTGLYRQDAFYRLLEREVGRAAEGGGEFALLMIDADRFKEVNDTHGHRSGDQVLQSVAELIRAAVRPGDPVARYGGEEFAVILPDMSLDAAGIVAERIRAGVEAHAFLGPPASLHLTLSIGIAVYPQHGGGAESLVTAADKALYAAKQAGRNRSVAAVADQTAVNSPDRVGQPDACQS